MNFQVLVLNNQHCTKKSLGLSDNANIKDYTEDEQVLKDE